MKGFFLSKDLSKNVIDVVASALRTKDLNLGLFFDKYVLWWKENNELKCSPEVQVALLRIIYNNPQEAKRLLENPNPSGKKFREKMTENVRKSLSFEFFPLNEYKRYEKRVNNLFNNLKRMGYYIKYLPDENSGLPLNWRLVINLGAASVYETSLLFHRNYSIPYIPGSAVKGVTRHWTIQKFAKEYQKQRDVSYEIAIKEVDKALENGEDLGIKVNEITFKDVIKIFGTQKQRGKVIFFDTPPVLDDRDRDFVVLDVMNVHYRDYYQDKSSKTPPGDWMNPNPIFFLAVEKGTKFRFAVASKNQKLAEKAIKLLKEAVKKIGIGAKTSAGYGYFEVK